MIFILNTILTKFKRFRNLHLHLAFTSYTTCANATYVTSISPIVYEQTTPKWIQIFSPFKTKKVLYKIWIAVSD